MEGGVLLTIIPKFGSSLGGSSTLFILASSSWDSISGFALAFNSDLKKSIKFGFAF